MTPQEVEQLKEILRSYGQNQTETIREELGKVTSFLDTGSVDTHRKLEHLVTTLEKVNKQTNRELDEEIYSELNKSIKDFRSKGIPLEDQERDRSSFSSLANQDTDTLKELNNTNQNLIETLTHFESTQEKSYDNINRLNSRIQQRERREEPIRRLQNEQVSEEAQQFRPVRLEETDWVQPVRLIDDRTEIGNILRGQYEEQKKKDSQQHSEHISHQKHIADTIESVGSSQEQSFMSALMRQYHEFMRHPFYKTGLLVLKPLSMVAGALASGLKRLFFGRKESDTEKIVKAIEQQTSVIRTGETGDEGLLETLSERGLFGLAGRGARGALGGFLGMGATQAQEKERRSAELGEGYGILDQLQFRLQREKVSLTERQRSGAPQQIPDNTQEKIDLIEGHLEAVRGYQKSLLQTQKEQFAVIEGDYTRDQEDIFRSREEIQAQQSQIQLAEDSAKQTSLLKEISESTTESTEEKGGRGLFGGILAGLAAAATYTATKVRKLGNLLLGLTGAFKGFRTLLRKFPGGGRTTPRGTTPTGPTGRFGRVLRYTKSLGGKLFKSPAASVVGGVGTGIGLMLQPREMGDSYLSPEEREERKMYSNLKSISDDKDTSSTQGINIGRTTDQVTQTLNIPENKRESDIQSRLLENTQRMRELSGSEGGVDQKIPQVRQQNQQNDMPEIPQLDNTMKTLDQTINEMKEVFNKQLNKMVDTQEKQRKEQRNQQESQQSLQTTMPGLDDLGSYLITIGR